ncbi:hypothetical protein [Pseudomonas sp. PS01298]|uniref:hypothetical protein n=1 Tax=Pseudomonas sp. PS01298 TaxID=2991434 RepID=UPI00249A1750|nr:hypothetical protein [Pseudomonas sp. PS01298]
MKPIYKMLALTSALLASTSQAADLYSQYSTPNAIKCTGPHNNVCTDTSRPDDIIVQYKDAYGKVTMQQESSFEIITCIGISDKCIDNDRNYRGKSATGRDIKYVVFKDFYVYPGGDGTDWAYKNGTGPLFGGAVSSAPVIAPAITSVKATPTASGTYDIWCDPQGDSCDLTIDGGSDMVSRDRLPVYVPIASDTGNCSMEFCYNSNQDVVGLNPDYHLWKK